MWTPAARAQLARGSQPYATCLTDAEWTLVKPFLPDPAKTGRPWSWPMRRLVDAILSRGGAALLTMSRRSWRFLTRCFADRAYAGPRVAGASPVAVTLVGKPPGQQGFAVQPRRWMVERSFARFGRCRRLARDHEATVSSAVAFLTLAAAMILVRRLAQPL